MTKIALQVPWGGTGNTTAVTNPATNFQTDTFVLANAINEFAKVAIYIGAFLMFFWMAWGIFDYIRAEGNKEALAKARKRIQWAVAGFVILMVSFFVSDVLKVALLESPTINQRKGDQPVQELKRP